MRALVSEKSQLGLFSGAVENLKVRPHPVGMKMRPRSRVTFKALFRDIVLEFYRLARDSLRARYRGERPSRHGLRAYAARHWLRLRGG